jgi:hypothetical protein
MSPRLVGRARRCDAHPGHTFQPARASRRHEILGPVHGRDLLLWAAAYGTGGVAGALACAMVFAGGPGAPNAWGGFAMALLIALFAAWCAGVCLGAWDRERRP